MCWDKTILDISKYLMDMMVLQYMLILQRNNIYRWSDKGKELITNNRSFSSHYSHVCRTLLPITYLQGMLMEVVRIFQVSLLLNSLILFLTEKEEKECEVFHREQCHNNLPCKSIEEWMNMMFDIMDNRASFYSIGQYN